MEKKNCLHCSVIQYKTNSNTQEYYIENKNIALVCNQNIYTYSISH